MPGSWIHRSEPASTSYSENTKYQSLGGKSKICQRLQEIQTAICHGFDLTENCWNTGIVGCSLNVHGKLPIFFQKIIKRTSLLYMISWFLQWRMFTVFFQNLKTYPGMQPVRPLLQSNLCLGNRAQNCLELGSLIGSVCLQPRAVLPGGASEVTLACKSTGVESSVLHLSSKLNHWSKHTEPLGKASFADQ